MTTEASTGNGIPRWLIARRLVQAGTLALLWAGANHHLGVLTGNLSASRVFRTIPLGDPYAVLQILATGRAVESTVLLGALLVLVAYFLLGGRVFCSWVCPINPVADLAAWIRRKFGVIGHVRIPKRTRLWALALGLAVSAATGVAAFEWISPIAMVHREIVFGVGAGLLAIPAIFLFDLLVVRNGWCGHLCPLGAFWSLIGRFSPVRVRFIESRCDRCMDCKHVCPEPAVIDFDAMIDRGIIDEGACTNCARCLEVCPTDAYEFTLRFRKPTETDPKGATHAIVHP